MTERSKKRPAGSKSPDATEPRAESISQTEPIILGKKQFDSAASLRIKFARSNAASRLRSIQGIIVLQDPTLSVAAFRSRAGNPQTESMLGALNVSGSPYVSSTIINEFTFIRLAFLNARSGIREIDSVVHIVSRHDPTAGN
jgi:hypothetical protein